MKYSELVGDIDRELLVGGHHWDAICCTINTVVKPNGELVMGAGVAKVFATRCSKLKKEWGRQINTWMPNTTSLLITKVEAGIFIDDNLMSLPRPFFAVGFPTKYDWRRQSNLVLIERSMCQLTKAADAHKWTRILLPRPGCANGGLDWDTQIKPMCDDHLDERFTVINGPTNL